eukprot:scaffold1655_cov247-Pinguiococcus_pyrenoidosus.AAC.26
MLGRRDHRGTVLARRPRASEEERLLSSSRRLRYLTIARTRSLLLSHHSFAVASVKLEKLNKTVRTWSKKMETESSIRRKRQHCCEQHLPARCMAARIPLRSRARPGGPRDLVFGRRRLCRVPLGREPSAHGPLLGVPCSGSQTDRRERSSGQEMAPAESRGGPLAW